VAQECGRAGLCSGAWFSWEIVYLKALTTGSRHIPGSLHQQVRRDLDLPAEMHGGSHCFGVFLGDKNGRFAYATFYKSRAYLLKIKKIPEIWVKEDI
jgi:hypothetical protein